MSSLSLHSEKIRSHLGQLQSGAISEHHLAEAVQFARAVIHAYLSCIRSSVTALCLKQGLTIVDLSYDCVAEVFARDTDNSFRLVGNFVNSLKSDVASMSDRDLYLAYRGFLHTIAEAQLARLFSQSDPSGARIHRNIRDALRTSELFVLERDFRGGVLVPRSIDPLTHLDPYPIDELEHGFYHVASSRNTLPELLNVLHDILAQNDSYRRSITLIDAVLMMKRVYEKDFSPETTVEHPFSPDGMGEFEILRLRGEVENMLKEKILLTYLVRGKITSPEAQAIYSALGDILGLWFSGEPLDDSLYAILNKHMKITSAAYEESFRPKMEYLVKLAREEVSFRLMKEL